jgi:CheY-like chemotaxis protein
MKTILVVDDDAGTRESLRTLFQIDYAVLLTSNAFDALEVLASTEVDLVLLDVSSIRNYR